MGIDRNFKDLFDADFYSLNSAIVTAAAQFPVWQFRVPALTGGAARLLSVTINSTVASVGVGIFGTTSRGGIATAFAPLAGNEGQYKSNSPGTFLEFVAAPSAAIPTNPVTTYNVTLQTPVNPGRLIKDLNVPAILLPDGFNFWSFFMNAAGVGTHNLLLTWQESRL